MFGISKEALEGENRSRYLIIIMTIVRKLMIMMKMVRIPRIMMAMVRIPMIIIKMVRILMIMMMVRILMIIMIVIASVRTTRREVNCKIFYTEQILKHHRLTPLWKIPNFYNLRFFTFIKVSVGRKGGGDSDDHDS